MVFFFLKTFCCKLHLKVPNDKGDIFCNVKSWLNSHKLLNYEDFFFIKREHHFFTFMHIAAHIIFCRKKWVQSLMVQSNLFLAQKKKNEGKLWIMWWMPGLGLYTIILFTTVNLDNFDVVFKSRICQITNARRSHALDLDLLR